jgi:hypothetical protein
VNHDENAAKTALEQAAQDEFELKSGDAEVEAPEARISLGDGCRPSLSVIKGQYISSRVAITP